MSEQSQHVWITAASGGRIRKIRTDKGLSQYDLAECVQASQQQIDGYERGEKNMPFARLFDIARALGVTAGDLLADD